MTILNKKPIKNDDKKMLESDRLERKYFLLKTVILTSIIILLSVLYLRYEWNRYQEIASSEAIQLAQSLESLLHPEHIKKLSGSIEDLANPDYMSAKNSLIRLVEKTDVIHSAYLIGQAQEDFIFLLNSEIIDSKNYAPPGKIYEEDDDYFTAAFKSGETMITDPQTDHLGTWIKVLVPMKDLNSKEVIAVLGIDYAASEWYQALRIRMLPDVTIIFILLLLYFALLYIWVQHFRLIQLNNKLALDEALYRSVFEQIPIGIAIMENMEHTRQTKFGDININPMYEKILGRKKDELHGITWTEITHTEDLSVDLEKFDQFKKGEIDVYTLEKRFVKPDGSIVWTNMKISSLLGPNRDQSIHLSIIEDISKRKQTEMALKESNRRESVILSHLPGLAYRCNYDSEWTMEFVSSGSFNLTGYRADSLTNNRDLSYNDMIVPEYRTSLRNEWERILIDKQPFEYEYEIITASGQRKWVLEIGQGIYNEQDQVEALEGIILDISDRKEIENNLRYINEHDGWTGLYNRDFLEVFIKKDIEKQTILKRALININLSTIQLLTVNYGFHYTQNLIKKAAEVLGQYCTDGCTLFQTYENRFVFYLKNYQDKADLVEFSGIIADALESLFATDKIGGGIGILEINPEDNINVDQLLTRLLIASERSLNIFDRDFRAYFYDEKLKDLVNREGEIMQALSKIAVQDTDGELFLQFQPIFDVKTGSICDFEALARLRTDKLGLVSPVEFIPIAEKTKLIIPIGERVIYSAFGFLNKLKEHGYETINISINVSAIQLLRPDFTERLFKIIDEMSVNPENISIEITESIFASDYESVNNVISKFRDAGLQIAIDDFGTGYSSLASEKALDVNCLKIDKYFIDKLMVENIDKVITSDIISMAHKLGHYVTAEGVEYENQLQYLKDHGCDKIQGYLISKPLDEEMALEFLKNYNIKTY